MSHLCFRVVGKCQHERVALGIGQGEHEDVLPALALAQLVALADRRELRRAAAKTNKGTKSHHTWSEVDDFKGFC